MKPVKFNEYITEESEVKKFRLLIITDEPEEAKTFHTADRLREEADKLSLKELSMGMSSDYKQAVSDGSTYIRLGTAILGERNTI